MEHIKAVLKRYDIPGIVVIASPTHTEYLIAPEASWSGAHLNHATGILHLRCKREDFPTPEAQHKAGEIMMGTLMGLANASKHCGDQMEKVAVMLAAKFQSVQHREQHEDRPRYRIE